MPDFLRKIKVTKIKCRLLQFLFGTLMVKQLLSEPKTCTSQWDHISFEANDFNHDNSSITSLDYLV